MQERYQSVTEGGAFLVGSVYQVLEREPPTGDTTSQDREHEEEIAPRLPLKFLFQSTPKCRRNRARDSTHVDSTEVSPEPKKTCIDWEFTSDDLERGLSRPIHSVQTGPSRCQDFITPDSLYDIGSAVLQGRKDPTFSPTEPPTDALEQTKYPYPPSPAPSNSQRIPGTSRPQSLQPPNPQTLQLSSPPTLSQLTHSTPSRPQTPRKNFSTQPPPPPPGHLATFISTHHTDLLMLTCCLISGLVDSTVYNAYGTFVSMQTGNTIFVGLGGSTGHTTSKPYGWAKSLASIFCFCLGCFCFSHGSRMLGGLKRGTLITSFLFQAFIIAVAAASVQVGVVEGTLREIGTDIDWHQLLPIALLSFQSAGQIVGSRTLGLAEIPTVVLTSMLHDITTDPALVAPWEKNVKRNRRVAAFFAILAGAVAGGFITVKMGSMQFPLWIAGGLKLGVAGAWVVWPATEEKPV